MPSAKAGTNSNDIGANSSIGNGKPTKDLKTYFPSMCCSLLKEKGLPDFTLCEKLVLKGYRVLNHEMARLNLMIVCKTDEFVSSVLSGVIQTIRQATRTDVKERFMLALDLKRLKLWVSSRCNMGTVFRSVAKSLVNRSEGGKPILILDEIHMLMEPDYVQVLSCLKHNLYGKKFQCFMATSPEKYTKLKEFDNVFRTQFEPIAESELTPPSQLQKSWNHACRDFSLEAITSLS